VYHRGVRTHALGSWLAVLLVLAACGAARIARANPCPCLEQWVAGRHVYVGEAQRDVRMESEALVFRVQRPLMWTEKVVVEVSADYLFVNRGAARELVIGFPIGEVHDVEGEISSFQVRGDGVGARVVPDPSVQQPWVAAAHPSECEVDGGGTNTEYREAYDWFLWKQTLRAGQSRVRVRYLQRWTVQDGEMRAHYVLRTAARWGDGRIGKLRIELHDPGLPPKLRWQATPRPTERIDRGRVLVWSLSNHRPARDLELWTKFIPGPEDRWMNE
jgi:hypothetical protein